MSLQSSTDLAQQAIGLFLARQYSECEALCRRLRNSAPNNPTGYRLAGLIRAARGEKREGFAMIQRAVEIAPDNADIHRECARAAMEFEEYNLAEMHLRGALDIEQTLQARVDLALCLITIGKWQEGWQLYDCRVPREIKAQKLQDMAATTPLWDGQPVETLLVHGEAGYGDMIQFGRWIPTLSHAAKVIYRVPRSLVPLMVRLELDNTYVEICSTDDPPPKADAWCLVMQLAHLSGCRGVEFTPLASYLERRIGPSPSARPQIGIVWGGSPLHLRDKLRSLSAEALEVLLRNDAVDWHLLQKGPAAGLAAGVLRRLPAREHITDRSDAMPDWEGTARLVEELDLVISIDSAPAHLAASVGCPTWVMLCTAPEFRWPGTGDQTPWYPPGQVRLFRQDRPGDWRGVALKVNAALAELFPTKEH